MDAKYTNSVPESWSLGVLGVSNHELYLCHVYFIWCWCDGDDPGDGDDPVGADDPGIGDADGDHLVQEEGGRAVLGKGVVCWRGL